MKNPYQILGVSRSATSDQIKKAYRELAKKYHPDANPQDAKAGIRFKEVTDAYTILGDEESRKKYDTGGKDSKQTKDQQKQQAKPPGSGPDLNSVDFSGGFESFFGFQPKSSEVNEEKLNKKKTKTDPLDVSDLFEKYMRMK